MCRLLCFFLQKKRKVLIYIKIFGIIYIMEKNIKGWYDGLQQTCTAAFSECNGNM